MNDSTIGHGRPEHPVLRLLFAADDEKAVISVIAGRGSSGEWLLQHATCLIVPNACADQSWAAWVGEAGATSHGAPIPPEFVVSGEDWLIARQPLAASEARKWVETCLSDQGPIDPSRATKVSTAPVGVVPSLVADLQAPSTVFRAMPHAGGPSSNLVQGAGRPVVGSLLRCPPTVESAELPDVVNVQDASSAFPARDLAGMHLTPPSVDPDRRTPTGLLVGKLERRAWIVEMRGTRDAEYVNVLLAWEPQHIDIGTLSLRLEEYTRDQELVLSEAVDFSDISLSEIRNKDRGWLRFPSAGAKLRHGVSLYVEDGALLDRCDPCPFVEVVSVDFHFTDPETASTRKPDMSSQVGEHLPVPALDEREVQKSAVRSSLADTRRSAADDRILRDPVLGRQQLRAMLEGARDYLLVMDPYFGRQEEDWIVVAGLQVPVRLLTTEVAGVPAPVPSGVEARIRPKGRKVMHDRHYLWSGGGLDLGGSLSTLYRTSISVHRLSSHEAAVREGDFEELWNSGLFHPLERR